MSNDTAPLDVGRRLRAVREVRYQNRDDAAADYRVKAKTSTALNTWASWENAGKLSVAELLDAATVLRCEPCWLVSGVLPIFLDDQDNEDTELVERVQENVTKLEQRFRDQLREDALRSLAAAGDLARQAEGRRDAEDDASNPG